MGVDSAQICRFRLDQQLGTGSLTCLPMEGRSGTTRYGIALTRGRERLGAHALGVQVTKQSVWEKPSELKTPIEKEMEKTPWKESALPCPASQLCVPADDLSGRYETGGRKYWVSSETKETTWDMPAVLRGAHSVL